MIFFRSTIKIIKLCALMILYIAVDLCGMPPLTAGTGKPAGRLNTSKMNENSIIVISKIKSAGKPPLSPEMLARLEASAKSGGQQVPTNQDLLGQASDRNSGTLETNKPSLNIGFSLGVPQSQHSVAAKKSEKSRANLSVQDMSDDASSSVISALLNGTASKMLDPVVVDYFNYGLGQESEKASAAAGAESGVQSRQSQRGLSVNSNLQRAVLPAAGGAGAGALAKKYEYKPVDIATITSRIPKEDGSLQNILNVFGVQVGEKNNSWNPFGKTEKVLVKKDTSEAFDIETLKAQSDEKALQLGEKYINENPNDLDRAFINLSKDIDALRAEIIKSSSQIGKEYNAVLAVAEKARKNINEEIVNKKVQEKLKEIETYADDISLAKLQEDYQTDALHIKSKIKKPENTEKALTEQYLKVYETVHEQLELVDTIIESKLIEPIINPKPHEEIKMKLDDRSLESEDLNQLINRSISQVIGSGGNSNYRDFLKNQVKKEFRKKIKNDKQEQDIESQAKSIANTIWRDYKKDQVKEVKKEVDALVTELKKQPLTPEQLKLITALSEKQNPSSNDIDQFKASLVLLTVDKTKKDEINNMINISLEKIAKIKKFDPIKETILKFEEDLLKAQDGNILTEDQKSFFEKLQGEYGQVSSGDESKPDHLLEGSPLRQELNRLFKDADSLQPKFAPIIEKYVKVLRNVQQKKIDEQAVKDWAGIVGSKLLKDKNRLNATSKGWLEERIKELELESVWNRNKTTELKKFKKAFGYNEDVNFSDTETFKPRTDTNFFQEIKTKEDLIAFYTNILKKYEKQSSIHTIVKSMYNALDSMETKSVGRATKDVGVAIGKAIFYMPMASYEAFTILTSSVDGFLASQGWDLSSQEYVALKIFIATNVLMPAATVLAEINASNMSDEEKRKARRVIAGAAAVDAVNAITTYQLGVSVDDLKSRNVEVIGTQMAIKQMMQGLTAETGTEYVPASSQSYTANIDKVMKRYSSKVNEEDV